MSSQALFSSLSLSGGLGGFDGGRLLEEVGISSEIKGTWMLTFLAWAFLLETFFGFAAVIFLVVVVFLEETLGGFAVLLTAIVSLVTVVFMVMVVSVVVTVLFAIMVFFLPALLLDFLGLLAAPLEIAFPGFLVDDFFAIVFLDPCWSRIVSRRWPWWKPMGGQMCRYLVSFVVLGGPLNRLKSKATVCVPP